MLRSKFHRSGNQKGFTFVEIVIVAPIVILTIGAFITTIVSLTGEILASRAANVQAYNVQDALNRIENDVKLSTAFLATSNVALTNSSPSFTSVQGVNDDTTPYENVGGSNGPVLILNTLATSGNPISASSSLVFLVNNPNSCTSAQVNQNIPMTLNVVYYVKSGALWRRTIMPYNYSTAGCVQPWQQPSCTPGYMSSFCLTQDIKLVDGIGTGGFSVQYFNQANGTTENLSASSGSDSARALAIQTSPTVGVTISSNKTVAGRTIAQSGTLRATRLDTNASTLPPYTAPTTPAAPVIATSLSGADSTSATFTWPRVQGATSYTLDYNINRGAWINGLPSGSTALTYTVQGVRNQPVNVRVIAANTAGNSGYGTATLTIPLFTPLLLQNSWGDFGGGYASSAYTKTSDGLVVLKGLIKGGTATSGTVIATLPAGYRPASVLMFTTDSNSAPSRVDVYPDGTIVFQVGSNAWLSLDGIKFEPTTSPYTFTAMTLSNSWVNYGGIYQTAGYTVDGMGRTQIQGLIKNGSTTAASLITSLPTADLPSLYQHLPTADNNTLGFIAAAQTNSTYPGAGIQYKGGSNAYLSLNNMFYTSALPTTTNCPTSASPVVGQWCNLTLQNGWAWFSSTGIFATPQYTKSADGVVTLKGLIQGGTAAVDTIITNLPVGYRPSLRLLTEAMSNNAIGRVDVQTNGNVSIEAGSNAWLSLDNINFVAEQ